MPLTSLLRRGDRAAEGPGIGVLIITGSCCVPGLRPFDEEARRVVGQAVAQTGVSSKVKELPASSALLGGAPSRLVAGFMANLNEGGRIGLPAVLVDGEVVSYGVPSIEIVSEALLAAAGRAAPSAGTPETPAEPGTETEHVNG